MKMADVISAPFRSSHMEDTETEAEAEEKSAKMEERSGIESVSRMVTRSTTSSIHDETGMIIRTISSPRVKRMDGCGEFSRRRGISDIAQNFVPVDFVFLRKFIFTTFLFIYNGDLIFFFELKIYSNI